MKQKSIMYLSLSMGAGHKMTVRALTEAVEAHLPQKYNQIDICNDSYKFSSANSAVFTMMETLYKLMAVKAPITWKAFFEMSDGMVPSGVLEKSWYPLLKKDSTALLESYDPDLIISTFPFIDRFLYQALKERKKKVPVGVIVTDVAPLHAGWISDKCDFYLVPTKETGIFLEKNGVPKKKIFSLGFPVQQKFYHKYSAKKERERLGLDPNKKTVIYFAGGYGVGKVVKKSKAIDQSITDGQLVVLCGKSQTLKERLEAEEYRNKVIVLSFVPDVARVLAAGDFVVSKAGGISTMELIAMKKPMIITEVTPGQEEPNARFIKKMGFGFVAKQPKELGERVAEMYSGKTLAITQKNLDHYHLNEGADFRIASFFDEILNEKIIL